MRSVGAQLARQDTCALTNFSTSKQMECMRDVKESMFLFHSCAPQARCKPGAWRHWEDELNLGGGLRGGAKRTGRWGRRE